MDLTDKAEEEKKRIAEASEKVERAMQSIREAAERRDADAVYSLAGSNFSYYAPDDIRGTDLAQYRDLFIQGMKKAESQVMPSSDSSFVQPERGPFGIRRMIEPDYRGFVLDVRKRGVNVGNYSHQPKTKAELLVKYFPGRFGPDGSQSVSGYDPVKVGALFKIMTDYSKGRLNGHAKKK